MFTDQTYPVGIYPSLDSAETYLHCEKSFHSVFYMTNFTPTAGWILFKGAMCR